jgi:hypothetical protein
MLSREQTLPIEFKHIMTILKMFVQRKQPHLCVFSFNSIDSAINTICMKSDVLILLGKKKQHMSCMCSTNAVTNMIDIRIGRPEIRTDFPLSNKVKSVGQERIRWSDEWRQ